MSKKITQQEFERRVFNLVGKEYSVIGFYQGSHVPIKMRHNTCSAEWFIAPANFISNSRRCPACNGGIKKTQEQFEKEIGIKFNNEIIVLSQYINSKSSIFLRHVIDSCGHEWITTPDCVSQGHGCPKCNGGGWKRTHEEFVSEVKKLTEEEYDILTKYSNSKGKVLFKHNICGHTFDMQADNFLGGQRCPICRESQYEKAVRLYLENHKISFAPQFSFNDLLGINGGLLRYDFAIFDFNNSLQCLIEADGQFHYEKKYENDGFETTQKHDKIKNTYCKEHNIPLLRIPYWDFGNIEEILDNFLEQLKNNILDNELKECI